MITQYPPGVAQLCVVIVEIVQVSGDQLVVCDSHNGDGVANNRN